MNINKILALPCHKGCSSRGADMGRSNRCKGEPERLNLQKIPRNSGGYDAGGAYWGWASNGTTLYCAFSPTNHENVMAFVWAKSRDDAKAALAKELPGFTFRA